VTLLGAALDALEQEGVNPKAANIARLWALTGCRRDEIAGLNWAEVDVDGGLLKLADGKTGKSIRPFGMAAIAILSSLARQEGSEFVFPAERRDGHYQGTKVVCLVESHQEGGAARNHSPYVEAHDGLDGRLDR
jgi:integrase